MKRGREDEGRRGGEGDINAVSRKGKSPNAEGARVALTRGKHRPPLYTHSTLIVHSAPLSISGLVRELQRAHFNLIDVLLQFHSRP